MKKNTEKINVLFIPPKEYKNDIKKINSLTKDQSKAIKDVGGNFIIFQGETDGELIEALKDVDVAINQGHSMSADIFSEIGNNGRCKGVTFFGQGFDRLDLDTATKNGVILTNTASFGTEEVSNHTIMLFLMCSRKYVLHDNLVRSGIWTRENLSPMGHIMGQTFGIIGLGNIGRAVARKAKVFGLKVIAYDPYISSWDAKEYGIEIYDNLYKLANDSDYVSPHVYLNNETKHMINKKFFDSMKNTGYIINCSRGSVIDEKSLIEALRNKDIAGAGLDVFEKEPIDSNNPLLDMKNVAITNHYASYSEVAWTRGNRQVGEEAMRIALGYWPMSVINPDVSAHIPPMKQSKSWEMIKKYYE
ncbi:MAG: hydroxyacid dehydrogenase [Chloroflexi bacterium]|nr:hydroxyacid dehydrogenase [Chloroflexota bacterium]